MCDNVEEVNKMFKEATEELKLEYLSIEDIEIILDLKEESNEQQNS